MRARARVKVRVRVTVTWRDTKSWESLQASSSSSGCAAAGRLDRCF